MLECELRMHARAPPSESWREARRITVACNVTAQPLMDPRARGRPWLLMAVLAVLSLGATVFVAQRALTDARDVVVRGEGDSLMSALAADLAEEGAPPTNATLERGSRRTRRKASGTSQWSIAKDVRSRKRAPQR